MLHLAFESAVPSFFGEYDHTGPGTYGPLLSEAARDYLVVNHDGN